MLSRLHKIFFFIVLLLFIGSSVIAADENLLDEQKQRLDEKTSQLIQINQSITNYQQELDDLNKKIKKTTEESDKKDLLEKKGRLLAKINSLKFSLEEITTGGMKIADYTRKVEDKPFNWQEELVDIFKPMIAEMKALTEKPRAIEKLRNEKISIEEHLSVAQNALARIQQVKAELADKPTLQEITEIEKEWQNRSTDLTNRLKLISFQLEEKLNPADTGTKTIGDRLKEFMLGRGLTLILALITFITTFMLFSGLSRLVEKSLAKNPNRQKKFFQRALNIGLNLMAIMFSLLATMLVLYIREDWLILGLIFLILLGTAWALRQSVPRYIREVKIMLNVGSVREGERVIYAGVAWKVTNLNFYTTFENPYLSGGKIKLPVDVIVDLNSRPHAANEAWFPNKTGDIVILDNDLFGPVILQTPDIVQMRVLGGSIKTYSTPDYLSLNPRNISRGFGIFITFGLDYNLQNDITHAIPAALEKGLNQKIKAESFSASLISLSVAFNQASGSSLDLIILSSFNGEAAADYFSIKRFLNRAAVELCTENNWNIPFDNLVVHLDK